MDIERKLTGETLDEVIIAMRTSLGRVKPDELSAYYALLWRNVFKWTTEAQKADRRGKRIPRFPLTGTQLRELQTEVDVVDRRKAVRVLSPREAKIRRRLLKSPPASSHRRISDLWHIQLTSFFLLAMLLLLLALNVVNLVLVGSEYVAIIAVASTVASVGAIVIWAFHHYHISFHGQFLRHHPHRTI